MKIINLIKRNLLGFIVGAIIFGSIGAYALTVASKDVTYNNTNVESAINDLYSRVNGSNTNNVSVLLNYASVNKNYTTIQQVLSDTATFHQIVNSNKACDYLQLSTEWSWDIADNETAMTYIGNNDYCANKLLESRTWLNAIANSEYFESVLNVKVPTMTSNTTPSGEASSSTFFKTGYEAFKIFDGNDNSGWISKGNPSGTTWVQYKFDSPVKIFKLKMKNTTTSSVIITPGYADCIVKASNDGNTFKEINTFTFLTPTIGGESYYSFNSNLVYIYWRVEIPINPNIGQVGINTLQFYGRQ